MYFRAHLVPPPSTLQDTQLQRGPPAGPPPAGLGAGGLRKEGEPPVADREITHVKGTSAVWRPGVEPPRRNLGSQGKLRSGRRQMGPPAGTSCSTCEDPEVEGPPKQQKETALLQGPTPQLLRPQGTGQWQEQGLWDLPCLSPTGLYPRMRWGLRLTPLYWPRSSPKLFLHSSSPPAAPVERDRCASERGGPQLE